MSFNNRRMTRPDRNQQEIIDALRKAGVLVWVIGQPCDLLTQYRGRWGVLEVKPEGTKRPRRDQERQTAFLTLTGCPVVKTVQAALYAVMGPMAPIHEQDWTDKNGKTHVYRCGLNPDPQAMKHMVNYCTCETREVYEDRTRPADL